MEDILIPAVMFTAVVLIVHIVSKSRLKRSEMVHKERMLAIERGAEIPLTPATVKKSNPFLWPLVLIGLGLAWIIANVLSNFLDVSWGLIPLFVGIAMYISHLLYWRQTKRDNERQPGDNG